MLLQGGSGGGLGLGPSCSGRGQQQQQQQRRPCRAGPAPFVLRRSSLRAPAPLHTGRAGDLAKRSTSATPAPSTEGGRGGVAGSGVLAGAATHESIDNVDGVLMTQADLDEKFVTSTGTVAFVQEEQAQVCACRCGDGGMPGRASWRAAMSQVKHSGSLRAMFGAGRGCRPLGRRRRMHGNNTCVDLAESSGFAYSTPAECCVNCRRHMCQPGC